MPRQCQFPVQCSDNRRCYRTSTPPGLVLSVALVAVLAGYVGISHAESEQTNLPQSPLALSLSGSLPGR